MDCDRRAASGAAAGGARDVGEVEHRGRREDVLEVLRVRVLEAVQRRVRVVLRQARLLRSTSATHISTRALY